MNLSPAIWSENRVQRWHSTQRSRSSRISVETLIGLTNTRFGSRSRDCDEPLASTWFCSGHSPPLSQIGQSSGWFSSRNSRLERCAFSATGELSWVRTTIPSATVWVQDACGLGIGRPPISTSTRHCRQAPTGSSSGWSQNRGMAVPIRSAVRITSSPLGAMTLTPSMVSRTWPSGTGSGSGAGAAGGGTATWVISGPPRADVIRRLAAFCRSPGPRIRTGST